ncbi:MAG: hypothetical protein K5979_12440 [Ruminococcus sp.]|nr:hypothetical protein [Ruminococcus sp.]
MTEANVNIREKEIQKEEIHMKFISCLVYFLSIINYIIIPITEQVEIEYFKERLPIILFSNIVIFIADQYEAEKYDPDKGNFLLKTINFICKAMVFIVSVALSVHVFKNTEDMIERAVLITPIMLAALFFFRFVVFLNCLESVIIDAIAEKKGMFSLLPRLTVFIGVLIVNGRTIIFFTEFFSKFLRPVSNIGSWLEWMMYLLKALIKSITKFDVKIFESKYIFLVPADTDVLYCELMLNVLRFFFTVLIICAVSGGLLYVVFSILYKILHFICVKGVAIMEKLLEWILGLNKPLTPGRVGVMMKCPFCGEEHAVFEVFNSELHPVKNYRFKKDGSQAALPEFLISKVNDFIKYNYEDHTFKREDDETVTNGEVFTYITGLEKATKKYGGENGMPDKRFSYIIVPQGINVYHNTTKIRNFFFDVCSECGFEVVANRKKIYYIGEKKAGKTSIIYNLISKNYNINRKNFKDSYDYSYWEDVIRQGKSGIIEATNVQKSPPLYIEVKNKVYCIIDVAGEKVSELASHINDDIVCMVVALEVDERQKLDIDKVKASLDKQLDYLEQLTKKTKNIRFHIVFSKSDNLVLGDNRTIFETQIEESTEFKRLVKDIKKSNKFFDKVYSFADPMPKNYDDSASKDMDQFIKNLFK